MKKFLPLTFALLLVFIPVCATAQDKADQDERILAIQEVTSDSGIKAWLVEDHTLPIIAMRFAFQGAGAAINPPEKQGLTQLLSNTMDEGAGPYDSQTFQKLLNDNNITLRFSNSRDNFNGNLVTLRKHRALAFDLLRLALNEARFDEEPVERMRAANLARLRGNLSDPGWKASRLWLDVGFSGHPYALNSGGTLSTLQTITADDLRQFVKNYLGRNNLHIAVAGDIDAEELKMVLDKAFGPLPEKVKLPPVPDTQAQNSGETVLFKQDIPQTIIKIMQPGIGRKHPEYYTGMVMNFILGSSGFGSRLTEEIREKRGLTYGIHSYFYELDHAKVMGVDTSTKNESVAEMMQLIEAEWQRMRNETVSDEELKNAKSYLIGSLPLSLSSTGQIAGIMLGIQLDDLPPDYLDKRADRINKVTKEDIQALAKSLLTPDDFTVIMVGNPQEITPTRTVEKLPNVE